MSKGSLGTRAVVYLADRLPSIAFIDTWRLKFWKEYIKARDAKLGREAVGLDKYGNVYYQYYSYHGLPTKRWVNYAFTSDSSKELFLQDVHFTPWLRR